MPVFRVNAVEDTPVTPDGSDLKTGLGAALSKLPEDAPIILMIHGYKYTPHDPLRCPHRSILALSSSAKAKRCLSWPRAMGFGHSEPGEGLCIAFGWNATGTIWQAAHEAERAAQALGTLLAGVRSLTGRPVQILTHSLGARVALGALNILEPGTVGRMVLLHGAEFRSRAVHALKSPAGQKAEIINVTTRENDLFDALFRGFVAPHRPLDPALSAGLGVRRSNWLDIRIDDAKSRVILGAFGFAIPAPEARICHWSAYMRPGMFDLHRALLRTPDELPLAFLAASLPDGARRGVLDRAFARPETAFLPAPT